MQIVIEISETLKKIADEGDIKTFSHFMWLAIVMDAIQNGTPLLKGHGDLIDRDALRESMNGACMGVMAGSDDYDAPLKTLDSATVVIEADRSVEE